MGKGANLRGGVLFALFVLCLTSGVLVQMGEAIWLTLPSAGTKCVSEEDDHSHPIPTISVKVTSPYGNNLHHQGNVTYGQFAFTTKEAENYLACFWLDGDHQGAGDASVSLEWKTGIAAKDWESVARKEKIEGVELELRKLEGAVEAIHENLLYLKSSLSLVSTTQRSRNAGSERNN
ncbi:hypothetical protein Vadar_005979 [Vaccinium darrowii]|uniref:Uncharacterized protein n=1 Tax=Vaccinium darrowii TaxID=229202 RepID=A0ACB7ZIN1_9ERIC|nr:hypothetical protein Vadar_005979 [Vaccinium darrowii]